MPTNLTGATIASTYDQLLHVDDGPTATEKTVYSGTGVATALKVGTNSASVDNLKLDGNTVSSTNTDGDINLTPNGTGTVVVSKADIQSGTIVSNNVTITGGTVLATIGLGYTASAGGTVTQLTSRATGVTLNQITGQITLFEAVISGNDANEFTLTNSKIGANDVVVLSIKSGCAAGTRKFYQTQVVAAAAGSCVIAVGNTSNANIPSAGTDTPVLQFAVIKSVIA
jgi:hypothetical protein